MFILRSLSITDEWTIQKYVIESSSHDFGRNVTRNEAWSPGQLHYSRIEGRCYHVDWTDDVISGHPLHLAKVFLCIGLLRHRLLIYVSCSNHDSQTFPSISASLPLLRHINFFQWVTSTAIYKMSCLYTSHLFIFIWKKKKLRPNDPDTLKVVTEKEKKTWSNAWL